MILIKMWFPAIVLGALVALANGSRADEGFAATPLETELCRSMIPLKPVGATTDWNHNHHYCDCIRFRYRAVSKVRDRNAYSHYLNEAVAGCEYVLQAASRSFPLRSRVHVENGRAYALKGDTEKAAQQFLQAMELKPTEVDAYIELADLQVRREQRSLALETVTRGLQFNPDVKALQVRYLNLGAKKPFPQPVAQPAPESLPTVSDQNDAQTPLPSSTALKSIESPESKEHSEPGQEKEAIAAPERGCRYCPPSEIQQRWKESFGGKR